MTTWYRTGLVNLTNGSNVVVGVGTEWSGRVLPGGIFFTPVELIEVERVLADGSLRLVDPYPGATVAGVAYAIAPTQGYVVEQSRLLGEVLTSFGDLQAAWEAGEIVALPEMTVLRDQSVAARGGAEAAYAATVAALTQDWGSIATPPDGSDDFGTL